MPITEETVRARAQALCDALVAGDVDRAIGDFSPELRRNLGEVLAMLPLPANEATIEAVERGGSGFVVVVRLAGEIDEVMIETRWKERDGQPVVVEAGHLSASPVAEPVDETGAGAEAEPAG